jgi:hypothetical protein
MTISSGDVRTLSATPGPGGVPLPPDQVERIAAVLNRHSTPRRAADPPARRAPHATS